MIRDKLKCAECNVRFVTPAKMPRDEWHLVAADSRVCVRGKWFCSPHCKEAWDRRCRL